jgi:hypothetical protein
MWRGFVVPAKRMHPAMKGRRLILKKNKNKSTLSGLI